MRFFKFAQIGIGIAAASGALVVFSGTALAAQPANSATLQSPTVISQDNQNNLTNNIPPKQVSTSSQSVTDQTTSTLAPPNSSVTVGTVVGGSGSGQDKSGGAGQSLNDISSPTQSSGKTDPPAVDPTQTATSPNSEVLISNSDSNSPSANGAAILPNDGGSGQEHPATQAAPDTTASATSAPSSPIQIAAVVVFHSAVLRIQPTIMNPAASQPDDLAATVPSAPVSEKAPVPAKSNGALGHLSAILASSVVPQLFSIHATSVGRAILGFGLVALLFLFASVFYYSYGLWLRRGGFATAARSDVPMAGFSSNLFATPLLLGYLSESRADDSPHLVVADTKSMDEIPGSRCGVSAIHVASDLPKTNAFMDTLTPVCRLFVNGVRNFYEFPTFVERRIYI
jgi:hypothetical protein